MHILFLYAVELDVMQLVILVLWTFQICQSGERSVIQIRNPAIVCHHIRYIHPQRSSLHRECNSKQLFAHFWDLTRPAFAPNAIT